MPESWHYTYFGVLPDMYGVLPNSYMLWDSALVPMLARLGSIPEADFSAADAVLGESVGPCPIGFGRTGKAC